MKRFLLLSALFLGLGTSLLAQRFDYEKNSKLFIGLNIGRTWHTSDVQNVTDRFPLGAGFIIGGSINQDYGNTFAFDVRLRYLGGNWYGLDTDTTGAIGNNQAVSNAYDTTGYAVQNFKSTQHRLSLELAIHANRFRERTGIDPYIFGGIGITATQTKGDLTTDEGIYDYTSNTTGTQIQEDYETPLDKNSAGDSYDDVEFENNYLPSIGVGLGYYLNSRFSIGLEHKSTFFTNDYFDGTALNQSGKTSDFNNDIYHYTSVYFRWYFKNNSNNQTVVPDDEPSDIDNYTDNPPRKQPPKVRFTDPSNSPKTVNTLSYTLRASIEHVNSSNDVVFKHDGTENHNFTFNTMTNQFQSTVQLKPGQNIFKLRGVNAVGKDEDQTIIIYKREDRDPKTPPVVNITDPGQSPHTVNQDQYEVVANVKHISSKQQLDVTLNGQSLKNFNFTEYGSDNFSAQLSLDSGVNTLKIKGTNEDGSDSDEATLIFKRAPVEQPPLVNFTNPSQNITVNSSQFNLEASVERVSGRNGVSFSQNGNKNNNFSFNTNDGTFSSGVVLSPGSNIFQLVGTNNAGSDQATVTINYKVEEPKPPIVSILNPSSEPHITHSNAQPFKASVLNVDSKSQVSLKLNGSIVNNFNFDNSNGILTAVLSLQVGSNTVKVTGTNNDGTDSEQTTIIYRKPEQPEPPVVSFMVPSNNPHHTQSENQSVQATVLNVDSKNQIDININGSTYNTFNFNTSNQLVTFNKSLIEGANTITITGTNDDGVDSETLTVIYKKVDQPQPPVVSFTDPVQNPKTSYTSNYSVSAKVRHVDGPGNIQLKINGNTSTNFNYSSSSEMMTFNAGLVQGANVITVKGTNADGSDQASTTILYKQVQVQDPPDVTITQPASDPYTTSSSTKTIHADVLNVSNSQSINVTVNGNAVNGFTFDASTSELEFQASLIEGNNSVQVSASNNAGSSSDQTTIIYDKEDEIDPPHVSFTNPSTGGTVVHDTHFQMVAEVENVEDKSGIQVRFNGNTINQNYYTFNPQTEEVTYNAVLTPGNNLFQVKGTNAAGSHESTTAVIYKEKDPQCDDPAISINAPAQSGETVNDDYYNLEAVIQNVAGQNDIKLHVNGVEIHSFMYDVNSHILVRKIDLMEGNNSISLTARNDCGDVHETTSIIYKLPASPCDDPEITFVQPGSASDVVETQSYSLSTNVSEITNTQQLQFNVNGSNTNFNFDLGTHEFSSTFNLDEGHNTIVLIAKNECGKDKQVWEITREVCEDPVMQLTSSPSTSDSPLADPNFSISGTMTHVTNADISVTHNGNPVNFVYHQPSKSFNVSVNLSVGNNKIVIGAENECGDEMQEFSVVHKPIEQPAPPTVTIANPGNSPYTTSSSSHNVVANTTNISANNQINVSVNGANTNFNFNANSETINFDAALNEGSNDIAITVVNNDGSDDAATTIVYDKPVTIDPPVVTFTSPSTSPKEVSGSSFTVTGTITNISSQSQMQLIINQQNANSFSVNNTSNGISFSKTVSVGLANSPLNITAVGTNAAGSDQASVKLKLSVDDFNCKPRVRANFSSDHKSVTATSNKDISNVVLKYSDQSTQKFDNLSGKTQNLSGTGSHNDKCIVGAWIKSGCNSSNDGPGYGEWIPNTDYDGSCETEPCESPVLSLESSSDPASENYTFQVFVDNVSANEVDVQHNGNSLSCNYTSNNSIFDCSTTLQEGNNTFTVNAHGCDTVVETYNIDYEVPCDPITYNRNYPASAMETVTDDIIDITLTAQYEDDVQVTVNNSNFNNYTVSGNQITLNNVSLNEGANNIKVILSNDCSTETVQYTIQYDAPGQCGPRFNPGNAEWQFCLVTPGGTYTRDDLANNSNFSYTGPASSIYLKPIAGGGDATVNGNSYSIQNGKYYHFSGNLTVSVSTNHPGSMGQWQACIEADSEPEYGSGGNRPTSPCESSQLNINNDNTRKQPSRRINRSGEEEGEEEEETKPNREINKQPTRRKPPSRKEPTRSEEKPSSRKEPSKKPNTRKAPTRRKAPSREEENNEKPENIRKAPTRRAPPSRGGGGR